jgi:hypothetical protein
MVGRVVAALAASDPAKFFMPPYVAHHGYVGLHIDLPEVDWTDTRLLCRPLMHMGIASIIKIISRMCPHFEGAM